MAVVPGFFFLINNIVFANSEGSAEIRFHGFQIRAERGSSKFKLMVGK